VWINSKIKKGTKISVRKSSFRVFERRINIMIGGIHSISQSYSDEIEEDGDGYLLDVVSISYRVKKY